MNLNILDVIPADAQDRFWAVVRDCLREFHGMTSTASQRKAKHLREKLELLPDGVAMMFYHGEPWDVACNLAKEELDIGPHAERYLYLRDTKHGFVAPPQPAPPVRTKPYLAVKRHSKAMAGSK